MWPPDRSARAVARGGHQRNQCRKIADLLNFCDFVRRSIRRRSGIQIQRRRPERWQKRAILLTSLEVYYARIACVSAQTNEYIFILF
jgi:hypothetical protein